MAAKLEPTSTPGIYRRGSRYVITWRHRGRQHKRAFRTLAEAREAKGRAAAGDSRPASRERFDEYASHWLDTYQGRTIRGVGPRTMAGYRRNIDRYALPHFRGFRLDEIEPPDVREFITSLERKKLRPSTIRGVLAPLRAMFATAVEDGALRHNPATGVRVAGRQDAPPGREVRALTRAELGRLLDQLPAEWRPFFEFLAHTGLRISEAIGLDWADVEFGDKPQVLVRRQDCRGDRRRAEVRLLAARRAPLPRHGPPSVDREARPPPGRPCVHHADRDGDLGRQSASPRARSRPRPRAGLPWVTFHTFRHTCASLLFEVGRDVKQVQEWLGHTDPGFTLRTYVHLLDSGVGDAAFFDNIVGQGGNGVATHHPETAANAEADDGSVSLYRAEKRASREQPRTRGQHS